MHKTNKLILKLREFAKQRGLTLAQLAIAWVLNQGEEIISLIGVRSKAHQIEDLKAVGVKLTEADLLSMRIL